MKKSKVKNIAIFTLAFLLIIVCFFLFYQNGKIKDFESEIDDLESKLLNNQTDGETEKYYDCSFTDTYRIVDILDGYVAETPELSYIVVDKYQAHAAHALLIPSELKKNLKENEYYEFTYSIKGNGVINDIDDVHSYLGATTFRELSESQSSLDNKLSVMLTINETDKEGMGQIHENICG